MSHKIWQKNNSTSNEHADIVGNFTVGHDREFDLQLARYDVLGSLAHAEMLVSIGLLTSKEGQQIHQALQEILQEIATGQFVLEASVEDIHSQIEFLLIQRIGEAGKKIHSGRSRNDQVLVDLKLFMRYELEEITRSVQTLFHELIALSEKNKRHLLPGYTHLQLAMPSSFGLWFGAYAESLTDDLEMLRAAHAVCNKNPLGSGAGYGSSFALNRTLTTELLQFDTLNYNVVYAQMTRGKTEKLMAMSMATVAATLARLAYDICLYMNQEFALVSFPDSLTTGSSIMPHKKNPDVFELIRARCNRIQALPNELTLLTSNLPSGYHRDVQLTKECLFPAIESLKQCLSMTTFMLQHIEIKENALASSHFDILFSVEEVNREVREGVAFRDAYKNIAEAIESNTFHPSKEIHHTHEGSMGNLCNDKIVEQFNQVVRQILKNEL
ncbi:MAG: argininosuccinate lyase [Bacteroidetes bacterium]|nr:argininosuccinate lyase [Bacteroidota bacterium]